MCVREDDDMSVSECPQINPNPKKKPHNRRAFLLFSVVGFPPKVR
jgi:hypothetical protein